MYGVERYLDNSRRHWAQRQRLGWCSTIYLRAESLSTTPAHWHCSGCSGWHKNDEPQRGHVLVCINLIGLNSWCKSTTKNAYVQIILFFLRIICKYKKKVVLLQSHSVFGKPVRFWHRPAAVIRKSDVHYLEGHCLLDGKTEHTER